MTAESTYNDPASLEVNITRIICCLALHVLIIPEIDSALLMMRYSINHSEEFKYLIIENEDNHKSELAAVPFMIATSKLVGAFLAEIINMVVICSSGSTQDVTKDFIAMVIIAEVDNILVGILNDSY